MNDIGAKLPLELVVDMIEQGSLEAQGEATTFLEDARLGSFDGRQFNAVEAGFSESLGANQHLTAGHAAELAIEYSTCFKTISR